MAESDEGLLKRVAKRLSEPPKYSDRPDPRSILEIAARAYSSGLSSEVQEQTRPTGFDPQAAALFEAVIESAYLVANADGVFDDEERATFKQVVLTACKGKVSEAQVEALVADFTDLLNEDGIDKRIEMVARTITRPDQATEVLRIAGLLAAVSAGINTEEKRVLEQLANQLGLGASELEEALREVDEALTA